MTARVLFVDDDADLLRGLGRVLRKHRDRWDMVFALGGPAGLDEVRRATFDVVVTDMRMPELDGAALLHHVRDHDPTTFRMILSGFSDQSAVTRALPLAHQFFDKPCDLKGLTAAIDRACGLRALFVNERLRAVVDRVPTLPPPRMYHELVALLARPGAQAAAVANVIENDPVLAPRILRLANAALGPDQSQSIRDAISQLGLETSAGLALVAHAIEVIKPDVGISIGSVERQHALEIAQAARRSMTDPVAATEAFTTGLVHDLGTALISATLPEQNAAIARGLEQPGASRSVVEREILGTTHGEVGGYLLAQWCIPLTIVEAVAFHGNDGGPSTPLSIALRAAHVPTS